LALGPGEEAIRAASAGGIVVWLLLLLLGLKALATAVTVGAGGVGGLFFPLVVMGTALGAAFGRLVGTSGTLFPLVGMASLLGSAYHTPLAGVSFVAEATGRAGFIIPTFVATAAAYATVGGMSISHFQRFRRVGPVERMLEVPVVEVATLDRATVPANETLEEFVRSSLARRFKSYAVVDDHGRYVGMVELDAVMAVPSDQWPARPVTSTLSPDHPYGAPDWMVYRALDAMAAADVDVLPIVGEGGSLIGLVRTSEVFRLSEIVDRLRSDFRHPSA
jgi:CIC family chloride channel protein